MHQRSLTPTVFLSALLALGPVAAGPATGEEVSLRLDPEASRVTFLLGATFHKVEGSFTLREGEIRFDPATGEATGRVVVDATSGDSGNQRRDRDMHAKVLESARFPRFVFTPQRVEGRFDPAGTSRLTLHGRLDLHGGGHPVAIAAEVRTEGDRLEAEGSFEVPYVEWGMKDPSKFLLRVSKTVTVTIHAAGRLGG